ncbi:RNA transcription, translation and transport factor protein isoform X2 [Drosophila willistoni]|uniref:RNA transcription, translation and transport factor protein isoform X2 n=1 Tax=Drosophila willistoni TaxID=7260 RepID=UPI000C26CAD7|nr:RNA transcription, translation and transport factor protein isoform X2 [Drosophila willistoni]
MPCDWNFWMILAYTNRSTANRANHKVITNSSQEYSKMFKQFLMAKSMEKEFIAGVRLLASKLKIPHHPNHLVQLEAVARVVHERLSPAAKNRQPIVGTPFPFDKGNDVVSPNDPVLDYPMRVLRLLQIQSLRQLQTQINETIVSVQNLTANPKTDTKLGKVGR